MKKRKFEYVSIYMPTHPRAFSNGCVYEHVLVAEQMLGRYLKKEETVHHIDRNKKNNDPNNLMVFATSADHIAFHMGRDIRQENNIWYAIKPTYVCEYCNKEFTRKDKPKGKHIYCSSGCAAKARTHSSSSSSPLLSKEELLTIMMEYNGNFLQAAKQFGITDNALRGRCKRAGLPIHSKDYKIPF